MDSVGNIRVEPDGDQFVTELSDQWSIWSTNGGYLAATLLRAALDASECDRPASVQCQFLSPAQPGPCSITAQSQRRSRAGESLALSAHQDGKIRATAAIRLMASGQVGQDVQASSFPIVPTPDRLPSTKAMLTEEQWSSRPPLWSQIEERPIRWVDNWEDPAPMPPQSLSWFRFEPDDRDPNFTVASMLLVLLDLLPPIAAFRAVANADRDYHTVSLDMSASLHDLSPSEWFLAEGRCVASGDGLIGTTATVWNLNGALAATAVGQLICRSTGRT